MTQITKPVGAVDVYLALIGVGGVGALVLTQLFDLIDRTTTQPNPRHNINLIYIANSRVSLTSTNYTALPRNALTLLSKSHAPSLPPTTLLTHLTHAPGPSIILDCTASDAIASSYPAFLSKGTSVVTPNKKGFASSQALFDSIRASAGSQRRDAAGHRSCVFYEASAGAGLPLMSTLTELMRTGDEMHKIQGVLSGTLSFLFNAFMPGTTSSTTTTSSSNPSSSPTPSRPTWSSLIHLARSRGYTEPDPRADLSGLDVARKLTIISRTLGVPVPDGAASLPIRGLVPDALKECSEEEFLARLHEFDGEMEGMRAEAEAAGKVLRYVGSVDLRTQEFGVGVEKFDKLHPIATLNGSGKFIEISTKRYGDSTLVIQGGSANLPLTAMSVIGDVIKVLDRLV